jgi:hypothetical protein
MPKMCPFRARTDSAAFVNLTAVRVVKMGERPDMTDIEFENGHLLTVLVPLTQVIKSLDAALNDNSAAPTF